MEPIIRTEFGFERTTCDCQECTMNCRVMPGYLIPSDLKRLVPEGVLPTTWAETHLLASPGAQVVNRTTNKISRIKTLVPATKPDGSCINLLPDDRCAIHENAPFGCAFFDHTFDQLSSQVISVPGLMAVQQDWERNGLYARVWRHLDRIGKTQKSPNELRERLKERLGIK